MWWLVLVLGVLGLTVASADAQGRIPFNAASAFSLRAPQASCAVSVQESSTTGQPRFVTRDCAITEAFVWYFQWPATAPTIGNVSVDLEVRATTMNSFCTATNDVPFTCCDSLGAGTCTGATHTVEIGCTPAPGVSGNVDLTFGAAATVPTSALTNGIFASMTATVAVPLATVAPDRWCAVRITRIATLDNMHSNTECTAVNTPMNCCTGSGVGTCPRTEFHGARLRW